MKNLILTALALLISLACFSSVNQINSSANGTRVNGHYIVEDFEGYALDYAFPVNNASLSALVKASPTNASQKAIYLSGTDNNRYFIKNVTLPTGKVLADYDSIYFDLYIESASYKDLELWIDGTKVHAVNNLINGTAVNLGTQKIKLSAFNQSGAPTILSNAGNTVAIGIGSSRMNGTTFYIDNVRLTGGGEDPLPENVFTVTLNAGTGTSPSASLTETEEGAGVTLPTASPSTKCAVNGYTFAGWASESIDPTEEEPDILPAGAWAISENTTLYAVYTDGTVYETNPACSASLNGTVTDGWLMLEDFEAGAIDDAFNVVAPYAVNQNTFAKIAEDPKDNQEQVVHVVIKNWDEYFSLEATLPNGKTLANYEKLDFDIYYNSIDGTDNGYKDFLVQFNSVPGTSNYFFKESTGGTGGHQTWIHKSIDLTGVSSGNTVTINLGIRGNNTNYFVDNIKLKARVVEQGFTVQFNPGAGVNDTEFLIEDEPESGITVPAAASPTTEANNASWSFYGWAETVVHETEVAPNVEAPSSTYHPESNITLYAVYTDGILYNTYPTTAVSQNGTLSSKILLVEDFETKVVGTAYNLFNTEGDAVSGTATIGLNPTNLNERAIHVVSTDYNNIVELPITLPEGRSISVYEQISFDFYWKDVDYKKMVIYINDTKVYEDDDYISQASAATWTKKTYDFDIEQSSGQEVLLRLGISSNAGDYYLDNISLKQSKLTDINKLQENPITIRDNQVFLTELGSVQVLDINGRTVINASQTQFVDLNTLHSGVYIVKALIAGNPYILKHIKK